MCVRRHCGEVSKFGQNSRAHLERNTQRAPRLLDAVAGVHAGQGRFTSALSSGGGAWRAKRTRHQQTDRRYSECINGWHATHIAHVRCRLRPNKPAKQPPPPPGNSPSSTCARGGAAFFAAGVPGCAATVGGGDAAPGSLSRDVTPAPVDLPVPFRPCGTPLGGRPREPGGVMPLSPPVSGLDPGPSVSLADPAPPSDSRASSSSARFTSAANTCLLDMPPGVVLLLCPAPGGEMGDPERERCCCPRLWPPTGGVCASAAFWASVGGSSHSSGAA